VNRADIAAGPASAVAVAPEHEMPCRYIEPRGKAAGHAPKFKCSLFGSNEVVRVKYGSREVSAEVVATRLLWALGFFTDKYYPVKLKCYGCPEKDPFRPSAKEARVTRVFDDTIIEENFPGTEIGQFIDQGWSWRELDLINPIAGGSSKAEVDALKLLAVLMQHTDSKRPQQRLACLETDVYRTGTSIQCKRPVLMIQDLGETFGIGSERITEQSAMHFESWSRLEIWNFEMEAQYRKKQGKAVCIGKLTSAAFARKDGISDPVISEEGRKFLADLLNKLSDKQIAELFRVGRAHLTGDSASIADWVEAFKKKRRQIADRRCF
ncbi:MAG TPA: hypothetical protein VI958_00590, partial [Acidobacteriota bacterium]